MPHTREITLDTETTGLTRNDRLIEIACVELINRVKTGNVFHIYINPMVPISEGASRVHGITDDMVADKATFPEVAGGFLEFISESRLIIHNADFDLGFLNNELGLLGLPLIEKERTLCTLKMARQKFPGSPASLDALCKKYNISLEKRDKHGALIDAELLAHVYLQLTGGTQSSFLLSNENTASASGTRERKPRDKREFPLTEQALEEHAAYIAKLKNSLWKVG